MEEQILRPSQEELILNGKISYNESNRTWSTIRFKKELALLHDRVLVFDTETTIDEYQNIKFGSFIIFEKDIMSSRGIFYNPKGITLEEKTVLEKTSYDKDIELMTLDEFINQIFYPEVLRTQTLCVGFNLPFDISRLSSHYGYGRRNHHGWFSFQLTKDKRLPRVRIKHIDSAMSFIEFSGTWFKGERGNKFKGHFLDLKTLAYVFSNNKHINLKGTGEFFRCKNVKYEGVAHGKITPEYIGYNLQDVNLTYEVYLKILEHYKLCGIQAPITKIYSSATLAKYALRQLGIQPLSRINSILNSKMKGKLMSAYFGGRCEVKIRKTPIEVAVLDFKSMYPSLSILMGLWDLMCAKEIRDVDVTEEVITLLKNITLKSFQDKEAWSKLNVLVELVPDENILPVRANYLENSNVYNVGINYFKHKKEFYYALPDVIASVLLTGKIPKIKKATRFIPIGKQETLKVAKILDLNIDPTKDNFIKVLVEQREKIKKERDKLKDNSEEYRRLGGIQEALKILANSITYGIFIEMLPQDNLSELKVYSTEEFFTKQKLEEEGKFFNPLIAVMQVAGARLLLVIAEKYLEGKGSAHAYMDTDSCYVPSIFSNELKDFFSPLNPYNLKSDFFKIEKTKKLFYGISAKRYVLYLKKNKSVCIDSSLDKGDYKLHGLGHLLNPYGDGTNWQKQIWQDILELHYGIISKQDIIEKYSHLHALSKLAISTPTISKRFEKYNQTKTFLKQIKPFNFILIGQGNIKGVKPVTSFSQNPQSVVHNSFIDYNTGKRLRGAKYWKNLADVILDYANHPESKFENGDQAGLMKRRHIIEGEIKVIGKETKNIEEQALKFSNPEEYTNILSLKKKILAMIPKEARALGIKHRSTLKRLKDNIRKGKKLSRKMKNILS